VTADALYDLRNVLVRRESQGSVFELLIEDLTIPRGGRFALIGPSGSGKSTFLDLLALVRFPQKAEQFTVDIGPGGPIELAPMLRRRSIRKIAERRRRHIGYVLQTGGLIPFISVRRNILLPARLNGRVDSGLIETLLSDLGLRKHARKRPSALSAGERQRTAIARALSSRPPMVLADEPTAALDPANADRVMDLLVTEAKRLDTSLVVASHDHDRVRRFGLAPFHQEFDAQAPAGVTRVRIRSAG
jgi:putative ABC transport system ATP-binding protein